MPLQRYRRYRIPGRFVMGNWPRYASMTTALDGADNDLVYTAASRGSGGNAITVQYIVDGEETPLSVEVEDNAIVVNVETDGSEDPVSTANDVLAAIEESEDASALVTVALVDGTDGSGVVGTWGTTALDGGSDWVVGYSR